MKKQNPTCIPCGVHTFRRNTYFNGKLLVERDFEAEQAYNVGKNWLHNSLLHGQGTVCGLKVVAHPNPECRDRFVVVEPGAAVDCCGREIIVPEKYLVPLLDQIEEEGVEVDAEGTYDLFLSVCFAQALEEKIPVILPDCDCADESQAYNRIREGYRFHLFSQEAGQREPARPPHRARLDWHHTITLARESPRALVVDDDQQLLYVATQGQPDEDFLGERLYVFRTDTHDLVTIVNGGQEPTDLALSQLGELIFLATSKSLFVFRRAEIRSEVDPAATIDLEEPARLIVSPYTGALFALLLESGRLIRWSREALDAWLALANPPPTGPDERDVLELGNAIDPLNGASILSVTFDGHHLFVVDANQEQLRVIDVASFKELELSDPPQEGVPLAVATSRDSEYLYVLWKDEVDAETTLARLTRYLLHTSPSTGALQLVAEGAGGEWPATPHDLALAPDERWAYVLQSDDEQGKVQVVSVEAIARPSGADASDLLSTAETVSGKVRYERLAVLGARLYVAADDEATDVQPERGLVAILDVEEAACGDLFLTALDGCPACENGDEGVGRCVVLAHIPHYKHREPVLDAQNAGPDDNTIDNLTHRPLVPSTDNITQVIRCMLEQGFAEGVPGPRGATGPRGPGITEAEAAAPGPGPGDDPTVDLEPVAGSTEGDQKLILGIPPGEPGPRGPRGRGLVEEVEVTTLPAGSDATAEMDPTGGPFSDFQLKLGIPEGPKGDPGDPGSGDEEGLTHIIALSWEHDGLFADPSKLESLLSDPDPANPNPRTDNLGLVLVFDGEVRMNTIFKDLNAAEPGHRTRSEIFQLYARLPKQEMGLSCECLVPNAIHQPVDAVVEEGQVVEITPLLGAETASAVRLVFLPSAIAALIDRESVFLRVVFRSDFALNKELKLAVDGNHIGGLVPDRRTGNGRQGGTFESWFRLESGQ